MLELSDEKVTRLKIYSWKSIFDDLFDTSRCILIHFIKQNAVKYPIDIQLFVDALFFQLILFLLVEWDGIYSDDLIIFKMDWSNVFGEMNTFYDAVVGQLDPFEIILFNVER